MSFKKSTLAAATMGVFAALGAISTASAVAIADGAYTIEIQITPDYSSLGLPDTPNVGSDGNWNTSLTINNMPNSSGSQGLFDRPILDVGPIATVAGNGNAGEIGIVVSGGSISATSFQIDTFANTAGGNFAQSANLADLTGTTGVNTVLNFDRLGHIDAIPPFEAGQFWGYAALTTGASTNAIGTVNGTAVANIGDMNGDGVDDYTATFVAAGQIGPEWGDFNGTQYIEIYNTKILSSVPVPAAVWLFGSGLIGLIGIARRKKA